MRAPLRIRRPAGTPAAPGGGADPGSPLGGWLERLTKLIPSEIVMVYLAGRPHAGSMPDLWPVICLALLVVVRVWGTREPPKGPQWTAIVISAVTFVIWVLAIGGRFAGLILDQDIAALVALVWGVVALILYRGD